jgi:ATP-dependent Clp protease ATP-binding subunit ClpA
MSEKKDNYMKTEHDIRNAVDDDDFDDNQYGGNMGKGKNLKNSTTPVLDNFSRDLTKMALDGKLDPIVGREKEIERVSQILSRRKKNNPVLIGEPGCVDGETIITIRKTSNENGHETINI